MSCDFGFRAVSIPNEHTFLSYSRNDCDIIAPIAKLVSEKRPIWYDEGLVVGKEWESMIVEQVLSCQMALIFVSRDLLGRDGSYVYDEYLFVSNAQKPALCVWLDDLREFDSAALSEDLAQFLQGVSALPAVSVYDLPTAEEKANAIITAMDELLKKDPSTLKIDPPKSETTPDPTPKPEPKPELPSKGGKLSKFFGSKLFKAAVAIPVAAAVAVGGTVAARHFLGNDDDITSYPRVEEIQSVDDIVEEDIVVMGEFEGKSIEWIVLDKKDDDVLLITKDVLCNQPFDDRYDYQTIDNIRRDTTQFIEIDAGEERYAIHKSMLNIRWDNCSLRHWLNSYFFNTSFSSSELKLINDTNNTTPSVIVSDSNPHIVWLDTYIIDGAIGTTDKIFLLSINEYNTYFSSVKDENIGFWWLRSPGYSGWYIKYDDSYSRYQNTIYDSCSQCVISGNIFAFSDDATQHEKQRNPHIEEAFYFSLGEEICSTHVGVRPAMWVHIGN